MKYYHKLLFFIIQKKEKIFQKWKLTPPSSRHLYSGMIDTVRFALRAVIGYDQLFMDNAALYEVYFL